MNRKTLVAAFAALLASSVLASEDDVILDVTPTVLAQSGSNMTLPALGGTIALTRGLNDRTDVGGFFHFDNVENAPSGQGSHWIQNYTFGFENWYTTMFGTVRPQIGLRLGANVQDRTAINDGREIDFHAALQLRAVTEFSTNLRGLLGIVGGADMGKNTRAIGTLDFGLQYLF